MSAQYEGANKQWLLNSLRSDRRLDEIEEAVISSSFDAETDTEVELVEKELRQIKFLKRVALLKLLTFPIEYPIIFILLGTKYAKSKKDTVEIYRQFYKNKIDLKQFKQTLQYVLKNNIIN